MMVWGASLLCTPGQWSSRDGKRTGYRYDLLNRQTHVQLPDGRVQENLYDGEGLRAGLEKGNTVFTFLFYKREIFTECDGDCVHVRRYLRGLGLSGVEDISTGTSHVYHQDEQGSTAYVTGTTGGTENLYSYDGFGNLLESREDITNRILYTGQQYDQETGQYYLRARYYNPVIGRFTQEDTYRGDGLNLYAYCDNNPVMYYDPSGYGAIPNPGDCRKGADGNPPDATPGEEVNTTGTLGPDELVVRDEKFLDSNGDIDWETWAPNEGRVPGTIQEGQTLDVGTTIDRYGRETGRYTSPVGVPYEQRALPYIENPNAYHQYEVCKPIDNVTISEIAAAFEQPGGGIQYELPQSVSQLKADGFLKEIF